MPIFFGSRSERSEYLFSTISLENPCHGRHDLLYVVKLKEVGCTEHAARNPTRNVVKQFQLSRWFHNGQSILVTGLDWNGTECGFSWGPGDQLVLWGWQSGLGALWGQRRRPTHTR